MIFHPKDAFLVPDKRTFPLPWFKEIIAGGFPETSSYTAKVS